ncbi:isomerase-domain-containing protein [Kockiozyma suomiensis]|uniref:isomerase-domain-containing protein n=1 Tax=Kockiozyma suomiensis TaxID=1337062 RepID=UPI0033436021
MTTTSSPILVKICGTRTVEAAKVAIESGADLIGMICVPNVKRTVAPDQAKAISRAVREFREQRPEHSILPDDDIDKWFIGHVENIRKRAPLVVGVFRNQPLEEVLALQKEYELDIVQLHGSEPLEWAELIPVPVMKKFGPLDEDIMKPGLHSLALLDGGGGEGQLISWDNLPTTGKFILAGGLTPENVAMAVKNANVGGVDVSSGVETSGLHDHEKIKMFIQNARAI